MDSSLFSAPVEKMASAVNNIDLSNREIYANYLAQTFYYVSHSTRMLAFAAGHMARSDEKHFRRFIQHIGEETSHEILAERDLADIGFAPADFEHLPETHALWEPQYYKMQYQHPLALMGYIIALELFAGEYLPPIYQRLHKLYGGKACRFVKLHAEEDPEHIAKAVDLTLTLPANLQEIIWVNVRQTAFSYAQMTSACAKVSPSTRSASAPKNEVSL